MNAALLAFLILLCSASSAAAEPISAAIISSLALTGFAASAVTIAVPLAATVGISLGLAALNKAMSPKPKAGDALSGTETNVQLGGDIARQIPIGIVGAKGHLVYHNSYGQQHEIYQQVYVLSDWPCDGLASVWVNGKLCTLTGGPATFGVAEYPGLITLVFYDGTQTAADGQLIALAQPPGKWSATSKLTGMAYVYVVFTYQAGAPLYEQGIPRLTFGLRGARLYDPRFDSTNGGSGGQRFNNPATWTFSQNPAIAIYNYLLGFHRGSELILGMGVPIFDVLRDTVIAAANICDEPVILDAGGTEARYRAACYLSADEGVSHAQTLEVLLSTMAGYLYDYGGFYYLQAGAGYTSAATITDDDLVTGAPVTFATKRSRAELINRIHGQWINPADEYQPTSYTPQVSDVGTAEDNEELGRALDLNSVPSQYQAERIAQVRLREVRRQATAGLTLGFEKLTLQAGDWITWASSRYGTRTYRIVNKVVEPVNQTVTVDLVETTANVYSWTASDDEGPPVVIGGSIVGSALITQPGGFTIQAVALVDGAGNQQPGLRFGWNPISDPTVDAVVIEWRQVGTTAATRISDPSVQDGVHQTTDGVVGGLDYEARATISTTPVRVTTWTGWVSTTTHNSFFNLASAVDPAAPIPTGLALSSFIENLSTGQTQTRLDADWNDVTGFLNVRYEIDIKEGAGNFVTFPTATSNYTWRGLQPGTVVAARVRSITAAGTPSGYSSVITHTVAADAIPPGPVTASSGTAAFETVFLRWTNPTDTDLQRIEVLEAATNNRAAATVIANVAAPGNTYIRTGLTAGNTRYYWLRAFDTSGNASAYEPLSATAGLAVTTAKIVKTQIGDGEIITQHMIANTISGDRIETDTLDANRVKANTVLAGSVKVTSGFTGTAPTLDSVADRALRPVDYINTPSAKPNDSTLIGPGVIQVSGGTTLSSWRDGGDNTQIAGGKIAANTITANKVRIGVRGIDVLGLDFQARAPASTSNIVDFSGGVISWIDDTGAAAQSSIAGGATAWSPGYCLYWVKGSGFLQLASSTAGVTSGESIVMAIYTGGGAINVLYGGTIIDGLRITTGSVHANKIEANTITATQVLQSAALITNSAMIADATIGTLKVLDGSISGVYASAGNVANGATLALPALTAQVGRRYLVNVIAIDNVTPNRTAFGSFAPTSRLVEIRANTPGGDMNMLTAWSWDSVVGFNSIVAGRYELAFPNIVGSTVHGAIYDGAYQFYAYNTTGITCFILVTLTELKR